MYRDWRTTPSNFRLEFTHLEQKCCTQTVYLLPLQDWEKKSCVVLLIHLNLLFVINRMSLPWVCSSVTFFSNVVREALMPCLQLGTKGARETSRITGSAFSTSVLWVSNSLLNICKESVYTLQKQSDTTTSTFCSTLINSITSSWKASEEHVVFNTFIIRAFCSLQA